MVWGPGQKLPSAGAEHRPGRKVVLQSNLSENFEQRYIIPDSEQNSDLNKDTGNSYLNDQVNTVGISTHERATFQNSVHNPIMSEFAFQTEDDKSFEEALIKVDMS